MSCLFCDIINKKQISPIIYEDDVMIVIEDKYPEAPVHLLLIPKKHLEWKDEITQERQLLIGYLFKIANKMAYQYKIDQAYKFIFNVGKTAHFSHIHLHLTGGWEK
jgi:histidine triad (HIT) family protein